MPADTRPTLRAFPSFQDALNYVCLPTHYERANNILVQEKKLLYDHPELKVVAITKSDKTSTVFFFFKTSTRQESWLFWCPSDGQLSALKPAIDLAEAVDMLNRVRRI